MSDRGTSGVEGAVLVVAAGLGALAGLAWAGAQAAALAFGAHHPIGVNLGDALAALPRLAASPGDPADAWPETAAPALPGPLGYWSVTVPVLTLATVLVVVASAWTVRGRTGLATRRRMGLDPQGRFARCVDLLPLWVNGPGRGRIILGWVGANRPRTRPSLIAGRLVATEGSGMPLGTAVPKLLRRRAQHRRGQRGSVMVLGPSQCGKTAALAVPAILEWDGPVIALSVKSDLMGATIARRRKLGDVRVFDPVSATTEVSDTWSPLREATTLTGARRAARSIANATAWTHHTGEMGFWTDAGEDLLAGLFWVAATVGMSIDAVVRWVLTMDQKTVRILLGPLPGHSDRTVAAEARQVLEAFDGVWRSDARQISSIYLTARQMIRPWQEPAVQASAVHPRIDLDWLLDGANTLYLCADLDEAERLAPVLGGLVDDLMKQAYARVGGTNTPLDPALLVVIDEAGNWPMRNLPGRISTCAGLGIQLLLVFQSKAQIEAAYDRRADVVVSNAVTKVFFAGLSDESTLRYTSQLLGDEHVTSRSASVDLAGPLTGTGGRRSVSEQPTRVDLMPGSLLRQLRPGQALLVHNTLRPAHLHGRYWFLEPDLYELATGQRCSRHELARRARNRAPNTNIRRPAAPDRPSR
jgi:type IV secretion system protein VirD4